MESMAPKTCLVTATGALDDCMHLKGEPNHITSSVYSFITARNAETMPLALPSTPQKEAGAQDPLPASQETPRHLPNAMISESRPAV